MLKTRVIPCLTIKNERLVKSVRFQNHRNIGSYISAVRVFNARNVDELIFLDIDARENGIQPRLLQEVTKECFMPVTLGGGVQSLSDIQLMLGVGADKVALNSSALREPGLIDAGAKRYGNQCIVISIDAKRAGGGYEVFSEGGKKPTGRKVSEWAKEVEKRGAGEILLTSIDRDGMMEGYDEELIALVASAVRIPVIISGGAGVPEDCVRAIKKGASAIAAASMFQYTEATPLAVKKAFIQFDIPARAV